MIRCGDFLASYRDAESGLPLPSYDLWEERWGVHTFTVAAVFAGLKAAESFADFFGNTKRKKIYGRAAGQVRDAMARHLFDPGRKRFLRSIEPRGDGTFVPDVTVDASIYAPFYFGVFPPDDERVVSTMHAIREKLWVKTPVGGIARYEGDGYHAAAAGHPDVPGNPWFVCTLWYAQWLIAKARSGEELREAIPILEWVASKALPSGVLAEQVHPFTGRPLSVSPLTWSHAAFVTTVLEYVEKSEQLALCPTCGQPVRAKP